MSVNVNPIEALLGAPGAFPPLLDIPPDADDETMVELAIALSLQVSTRIMIIANRIAVAGVFNLYCPHLNLHLQGKALQYLMS